MFVRGSPHAAAVRLRRGLKFGRTRGPRPGRAVHAGRGPYRTGAGACVEAAAGRRPVEPSRPRRPAPRRGSPTHGFDPPSLAVARTGSARPCRHGATAPRRSGVTLAPRRIQHRPMADSTPGLDLDGPTDWRAVLAGVGELAGRERRREARHRPRAAAANELLHSVLVREDGLHLRFFRRRTRLRNGEPGAASGGDRRGGGVRRLAARRGPPRRRDALGRAGRVGLPLLGQRHPGAAAPGRTRGGDARRGRGHGPALRGRAPRQPQPGGRLPRGVARRAGVGLPAGGAARRRGGGGSGGVLPRRAVLRPRRAGAPGPGGRPGVRVRPAGGARPPVRALAGPQRPRPARALAGLPPRGRPAAGDRRGGPGPGRGAVRPPRRPAAGGRRGPPPARAAARTLGLGPLGPGAHRGAGGGPAGGGRRRRGPLPLRRRGGGRGRPAGRRRRPRPPPPAGPRPGRRGRPPRGPLRGRLHRPRRRRGPRGRPAGTAPRVGRRPTPSPPPPQALAAAGWRLEFDGRAAAVRRPPRSRSASPPASTGSTSPAPPTSTAAELELDAVLAAIARQERYVAARRRLGRPAPRGVAPPLRRAGPARGSRRRGRPPRREPRRSPCSTRCSRPSPRPTSTTPPAPPASRLAHARRRPGPADPPPGFTGELRDYQRAGLGWLHALDARRPLRLPRRRDGPGQNGAGARVAAGRGPARRGGGGRAPSARARRRAHAPSWRTGAARRSASRPDSPRAHAARTRSAGPPPTPPLRPRPGRTPPTGRSSPPPTTPRPEAHRRSPPPRTNWSSPPTARSAPTPRGWLGDAPSGRRRARRGPGDQEPAAPPPPRPSGCSAPDRRLAVTGTPVENHLGELLSVFDFLNPGMLRGATEVLLRRPRRRHHAGGIDGGDDARRAARGHRRPPALHRPSAPSCCAARRSRSPPSCPSAIEETLWCEMGARAGRLLQEARRRLPQEPAGGDERAEAQDLEDPGPGGAPAAAAGRLPAGPGRPEEGQAARGQARGAAGEARRGARGPGRRQGDRLLPVRRLAQARPGSLGRRRRALRLPRRQDPQASGPGRPLPGRPGLPPDAHQLEGRPAPG